MSGIGYPLTQLLIDRLGRLGAILTEVAAAGLTLRDATFIRSGTSRKLRQAPAALLWLELAAALGASGLGMAPIVNPDVTRRSWRGHPLELARRAAIGTLFGLHTWRFFIYLQSDQGRRLQAQTLAQANASAAK